MQEQKEHMVYLEDWDRQRLSELWVPDDGLQVERLRYPRTTQKQWSAKFPECTEVDPISCTPLPLEFFFTWAQLAKLGCACVDTHSTGYRFGFFETDL